VWGQTFDFTGVSFFQRGRTAANAVAREVLDLARIIASLDQIALTKKVAEQTIMASEG
jgi:hypothetical protein